MQYMQAAVNQIKIMLFHNLELLRIDMRLWYNQITRVNLKISYKLFNPLSMNRQGESRRICSFFAKGDCRYGASCRYLHSKAIVQVAQVQPDPNVKIAHLDTLSNVLISPTLLESGSEQMWICVPPDPMPFYAPFLRDNLTFQHQVPVMNFIHASFYALNGPLSGAENWISEFGGRNAPRMARIVSEIIESFEYSSTRTINPRDQRIASFQSCLVPWIFVLTHTRYFLYVIPAHRQSPSKSVSNIFKYHLCSCQSTLGRADQKVRGLSPGSF
jgi:hypothetical protein